MSWCGEAEAKLAAGSAVAVAVTGKRQGLLFPAGFSTSKRRQGSLSDLVAKGGIFSDGAQSPLEILVRSVLDSPSEATTRCLTQRRESLLSSRDHGCCESGRSES